MQALSEGEPQRELARLSCVDLSEERDVAVLGHVELPVHPEVLGEIGPAVRDTVVPAGAADEREGGSHRGPPAALLRGPDTAAGALVDVAAVLPPPPLEVRGEE